MASESRVSDGAWIDARRMWERGEASVKQVADSLGVSKSLVMKRKAAEGWQLNIGVAPVLVGGAAKPNSKVTENAGERVNRTGSVSGHQAKIAASQPASMPSPAPTHSAHASSPSKPAYAATGAFQIAEPAKNLAPALRREHIRRECEALATAMNDRHALELRSLQAAFATEMNKGNPNERGAALRIKALTEATAMRHKMQRETLIDFTKLRLGEFDGLGTGTVIIVHMVPGLQFDGGAPVAGTRAVQAASIEDAARLMGADVIDVDVIEPKTHTQQGFSA
jgi:hypothetical protein